MTLGDSGVRFAKYRRASGEELRGMLQKHKRYPDKWMCCSRGSWLEGYLGAGREGEFWEDIVEDE